MRKVMILVIVVCVAPGVFADKLYLKDGAVMEGRIRKVTSEYILLEKDGKELKVPGKTILAYDKDDVKNTPIYDEYLKKIQAVDRKKAESWFSLGEWCMATDGYRHVSRYYYRFALEVDANYEPAAKKLGLVQHEGKWVTKEEKMDALGLVKYQGNWIKKEAMIEKVDQQLSSRRLEVERLEKEVAELRKTAAALKGEIARAKAELRKKYRYKKYRYGNREMLVPNDWYPPSVRNQPRYWYNTGSGMLYVPYGTIFGTPQGGPYVMTPNQ